MNREEWVNPDNTEKTGSYIGFEIDISKDKVTALNIPVKNESGRYSNAYTNEESFKKVIVNTPKRFSIKKVLKKSFSKKQRTKNIDEADIVISRKSAEELNLKEGVTLLHPGRNGEELQKLFF